MASTTLAEAMSECTKFSRRGLDFWVKQKCEMFYQNCGEQKFFMCLAPFPRIGDGKRNPIMPSSCGSRLYRRGIIKSFDTGVSCYRCRSNSSVGIAGT